MNLGEFHAQVSADIRRGTTQDAQIPKWTRQAALFLERNKTMNYMRRFATVNIDLATNDTPRFVELTDTRIKSIQFFRWVNSDGTFSYMEKKDPRDMADLASGTPEVYWPSGVSTLVLSSTPDTNLSGELWLSSYSAWPTNLASTHWLIENAEDVLEAGAMMNAGKHLRDQSMYAFWKTEYDKGLVSLYAAEDEFAQENTNYIMEYAGEG